MLLLGYAMGIRSERRLCEEVHLNLAYRWFCRLDLTDPIPDHSTFSKNRHGRFRDSDLFQHLFETVLSRCIAEGPVGGDAFGVDASIVQAPRAVGGDKGYDSDANRAMARERGAVPVIPYRKGRKAIPVRFAKALYRGRARIEQIIGKLKRFKRVALAASFILLKSVHTA